MTTRYGQHAPRRWPALTGSVLLHLGVLALLLLRFAPVPSRSAAPLAVELWAGGGAGQAAKMVAVAPVPAPELAPPPPVPAVVPPAPSLPDAQVKLAPKTVAKPESQVPPAPARETAPAKTPARAEKAPVAKTVPPAPVKRQGGGDIADDLLAGLGGPAGPGKGVLTQKGSKQGVAGGVSDGQSGADAGYLDKVRGRIRPYVLVPPGVSRAAQVELKVTLLPTLEVRSVVLVKSSGNPAYDAAVEAAVWQARTFPPLPAGARFTDYREYRLRFRPQD